MGTPHKHAELIKAWADGAEIEVRLGPKDKWRPAPEPSWTLGYEYRIKLAKKPNVVTWAYITPSGGFTVGMYARPTHQSERPFLRIEIDHNDPDNLVLVSATLEKP